MESNNKRIAKNTIMLYIRMLLSMLVGLYTSRVVLQVLGVEDYGIYGVVGSIVSMMGFICASMSGATSRFISFELGRGNIELLKETFSTALIIHVCIAILIVILGETIGLWFLCNKLVIPIERMPAAHWVFQMSILSAAIGITQVPYSACIISHEKMDIYAYFELLHVFLKLLIVYLLVISPWDKLKIYSSLVVSVSIVMRVFYRVYCIRHYKEASFSLIWNKNLIKRMLSFTSQTIFAHFSFSIRQQGINFVLNIIFGVIVNASNGIATTVNGIISQFSHNLLVAFNPQIIKNYAKGKLDEMNRLLENASKYSLLLLALFVVPIEFEMPQVLKLWLGIVPEYTVIFARLSLLSLFTAFSKPLYTGLMATGKIRGLSYIQGSLYILTPFLVYFICSDIHKPEIAYYMVLMVQFSVAIITLLFLKKKYPYFCIRHYIGVLLIDVVLPISLTIVFLSFVHHLLSESLMRIVISTFLSTFVLLLFTYSRMDKTTKSLLHNKIKTIFP